MVRSLALILALGLAVAALMTFARDHRNAALPPVSADHDPIDAASRRQLEQVLAGAEGEGTR